MVKKISLFVSIVLGLVTSLRLLPEFIMCLAHPNSLGFEEIGLVIVFLFSAPILLVALTVAIKSLRKTTYETFAISFNFFGSFTIAIYEISGLIPLFKDLSYYEGFDFFKVSLIASLLVDVAIVLAIMIFAALPVFIRHSETHR